MVGDYMQASSTLKSMNSKIVTDYTTEYQEKYNKNPKEFI